MQTTLSVEVSLDKEMQRALERLEKLRGDSIEYWSQLVELGELQSRAGDDYQAEKTFLRAERGLSSSRMANPTGAELADALVQSFAKVQSGTREFGPSQIVKSMQVRSLHQRIHMALSHSYERLGDLSKAAQRLQLAENLDSKKCNDDFTVQMLKALEGDLGKLL